MTATAATTTEQATARRVARCDSLGSVLTWIVAVLLFLVIVGIGIQVLRAMGGAAQPRRTREDEPEDVVSLAVFLVCRECGTEFQVTRLGEVQVPRHCGEPMEVVRRPVPGDASLG
jgi:hypothetical protein